MCAMQILKGTPPPPYYSPGDNERGKNRGEKEKDNRKYKKTNEINFWKTYYECGDQNVGFTLWI
jgi:hypothetical protein